MATSHSHSRSDISQPPQTDSADLDILASYARRAGQSTVRLHSVTLLDVENRRTSHTLARATSDITRTSEANRAKVGERHERRSALKVLDNPFGVRLAKRAGRTLVAESVADTLAGGQVLDGSRAGCETGGFDSRLDRVAGLDGEAAEGVAVVWVPFVPGFVGGLGAFDEELDAGLENGYAYVSFI